jgi:hypothetical protein
MSMAQDSVVLKSESLVREMMQIEERLDTAFHEGTAIHEVESDLWKALLAIGHALFAKFLALHGSGDRGENVTLPDGREHQRLPELHPRRYVSIFGEFLLQRTVYGTREGQKHEFIPLDNVLQLPESVFSYVLQDWDQALCVEQAFGQVNATISRILQLKQSVGSLEHMNQEMAQTAESYMLTRPLPAAAEEGEIFVGSADGKGIVMRRDPEAPAPKAHLTKGDKASQKRMATVGAVYSVDRYVRTPEQVVAALFRDEPKEKRSPRPRPQHKQVWASLPQDDDSTSGMEAVFTWLDWELRRRNPGAAKETVYLCDGQETLWQAVQTKLPGGNAVEILDLLHVTPRLWKAAHVFHGEKSQEAELFVRERLLRVLQGKTKEVIRGLREMGTKRGLTGNKKKTLQESCNYLEKNLERLRYDEYLAAGYPIASGVIEGACRHLVKDRMERAGMHWTAAGAQAMLDVRSVFVSGQWEEYQSYRLMVETERLYPDRKAADCQFNMAP